MIRCIECVTVFKKVRDSEARLEGASNKRPRRKELAGVGHLVLVVGHFGPSQPSRGHGGGIILGVGVERG